jgi:preprotein translocase subunit YajC
MFISPAYAQTGGGGFGGFDMIQLAPLLLIFVVFYFLIIRPQQKKVKEHKSMVDALRRGDRVVTSGGLIGMVTKVVPGDAEATVEIADGVRVKVRRTMISEVLARTEPAEAREGKEAKESRKTASVARAESPDDFYTVLGVARSASAAEIAAAHAGKSGEATANEAYETLKDPMRRKLYDSLGHDDYQAHLKG